MKPVLFRVKAPLEAREGDYILVLGDEALCVVPSPGAPPPSQELDTLPDSILKVIRDKGVCSARRAADILGIPRNDKEQRAEVSRCIKRLLIARKIRGVIGASRLGPYEVVR